MFYPYSKTFYSTSFCFLYTILSSKTLAWSLMTNQTCISLSSFHFPCQSSASLSTKVAKCVRLSHSHCQDPGGLHLVIQLFLLRISLSPFYQWFLLFLSQVHSISQAPHTLQRLQAHQAQHNPTFKRGLLHSGCKGASFGESQSPAYLSEEVESESLSIGVIQLVWLLELKVFFLPDGKTNGLQPSLGCLKIFWIFSKA